MAKKIVVLGAGESGTGAAILAKAKGFDVFVSDLSEIKEYYRSELDKRGIEWEQKQHTQERILAADEVIKSPGIPKEAPIIQKLMAQGTPIISEIEFAGRYTNAKMICITGSNGKTTTTSLMSNVSDENIRVGEILSMLKFVNFKKLWEAGEVQCMPIWYRPCSGERS